ncbi:OmpA family protein [Solimonas soli]|uniref:OmpA family protein n=1 Tax=Solimonas soli TaxID=413479 RepID=UPI0004B8B97F|nr:OmpA family protein [Solimonas soli]
MKNFNRGRQPLLAAILGAGSLFAAASASAYTPGWYFEVDGLYTDTQDSHGTTYQPAVAGTPGSPGGRNCLLGDLLGLGTLIDNLGGTGPQGCLLGLLGPDIPPTDPTGGTPAASFDTTIRYKGGFGGGATLGYMFDGGLRPELNFTYSQADWDTITLRDSAGNSVTSSPDSAKLKAMRLMANAWYDIDFGTWVVPYLGGGVGYQRTEISGSGANDSDNGFAWQLGAGVGFLLSPRTTLSLDYRFVNASDPEFGTADGGKLTTEYQSHNVGLGLRYAFGNGAKDSDGDGVPDRLDKCPGTPAGVHVYSNGCPIDADGDGVPDYLDKCPNTPAGVQVDASGCPLDSDGDGVPDYLDKCPGTPKGVHVNADGCNSADSDGDGIPDDLDRCPNTPAGVAVGQDGCPLDSDGDGIPDYLDECPHSPPGAKVLPNGCALVGDCRKPRPGEQVDANGCAVDKNFILKGVKFEFDSDRLTPEAQHILNHVATTLQAYPNVNVEVEGHTDNIGSDSYNLGLSERRAIAVKKYLTDHGVAAKRMTPVGYGETRPIDSNETEEGRENNRRVELHVAE